MPVQVSLSGKQPGLVTGQKWSLNSLVNCPTQPTCFAHFDLCICQLSQQTESHKSSLLKSSEIVNELVSRVDIDNDRTWVR